MENKQLIPVKNICSHYEVEITFIHSLREYGLVELANIEGVDHIHADHISDLEKMMRLYYELEINMEGIDAISHLLNRVNQLEKEVNVLRNRLRIYENE